MKIRFNLIAPILLFFFITACQPANQENSNEMKNSGLSLKVEDYGSTDEGPVQLYTLKNKNNMEVGITNYGGIVTSIVVADKGGNLADVTLGFDSFEPYLGDHPFFGGIIGRYGNRIAKGKFSIDGTEYSIPTNNGANTLHGGERGFDKRLWSGKGIEETDRVGVQLTRSSPDMEEGYPGNLDCTVSYFLNNDNELLIEYEAKTDKKTVVNLTNHAYFNLKGAGVGDILDHELMINADAFTPVDETLIPTGELRPVEGTPFDFRTPTAIGARVNDKDNEQIQFGLGYDHNYVLNKKGDGLEVVASVYEPNSGRFMEVLTEEPGVQFYCGNFLDGSVIGKGEKPYNHRTALCLETQHFPDSPNKENFPSTLLEPGQTYSTKTVYRFSTK